MKYTKYTVVVQPIYITNHNTDTSVRRCSFVKQDPHWLNRCVAHQTVALTKALSIQKNIYIIQKNTWLHFTQDINICLRTSSIVKKWNLKPWTLYKGPHHEYDGKPTLESVRKPVSRTSNGSFSWQRKLLPTMLRSTSTNRGYWWSNTLEGNQFNDLNSVHMFKLPFDLLKKKKVEIKSNVSFDLDRSNTICKKLNHHFGVRMDV